MIAGRNGAPYTQAARQPAAPATRATATLAPPDSIAAICDGLDRIQGHRANAESIPLHAPAYVSGLFLRIAAWASVKTIRLSSRFYGVLMPDNYRLAMNNR